ncbi:hypothetical protein BD770DRAFT_454327 [Pilaira anomala]|nr:hypothetical protein BD770DRAFT_454327 [Pilaira anomala]
MNRQLMNRINTDVALLLKLNGLECLNFISGLLRRRFELGVNRQNIYICSRLNGELRCSTRGIRPIEINFYLITVMGKYIVKNVKVYALPKVVVDIKSNIKVDFSIKEEGNFVRLTSYRSDMISFVLNNVTTMDQVITLANGVFTWRSSRNMVSYCNTYCKLVLSRLKVGSLACVPLEVDPLTIKYSIYKYALKYFADETKVKSNVSFGIVMAKLSVEIDKEVIDLSVAAREKRRMGNLDQELQRKLLKAVEVLGQEEIEKTARNIANAASEETTSEDNAPSTITAFTDQDMME